MTDSNQTRQGCTPIASTHQTEKGFFTAVESMKGRFAIIARWSLLVAMIYPVYTVISNVQTKGPSWFSEHELSFTTPFYQAAFADVLFLIAVGWIMVIVEIRKQSRGGEGLPHA